MFEKTLSELQGLAIHKVGNKSKEEDLILSQGESGIDQVTRNILWHYLTSAFKENDFYRFHHPSGLSFNSVHQVAAQFFKDPAQFIGASQKLAQLLFEVSDHPQIKSGELMVLYFSRLRHKEFDAPAIALFKSEQKHPFLFTEQESNNIELYSYQGINPGKVDKAALIFSVDEQDGFHVLATDNVNKGEEAKFWFEQFLRIQIRSTEYSKTSEIIKATKSFIDQDLRDDTPLEKTESMEYFGRSKDYFSIEEDYNPEEYSKQVFEDEGVADRFREYVKSRDTENLELDDNFAISEEALKKKNRIFKSVIKLDKNFHIYVHGNHSKISKEKEEDGRQFYKLYFDEES